MKDKITIELNMHPLAWRVLKNNVLFDGIAFDIEKSWLYNLIIQNLQRKKTIMAGTLNRVSKKLVAGKIYITKYDFDRFGGEIRIDNQAGISQVICKYERDKLCKEIATAHVFSGIGRGVIIRYLMDKYDYEDDELKFATLKKHYQRHCIQYEDSLSVDLMNLKKLKRTQKRY